MRPVRTGLTIGACLVAANVGAPCATVYVRHPIAVVDEKVIIVWDADSKTQHFVRLAKFKGEEEDFGFIVPTPTQPQVVDVNGHAFDRIEYMINPRNRGGYPPAFGEGFGGSGGGVTVLEKKQVGDYKATILMASDGTAMLEWLKENGFNSRPALEEWLDHYAKEKWVFTALRYDRPADSNESQTTALRLSFKTPQPFYPYRMPADSWQAIERQPMAVYIIAEGQASGSYIKNGNRWIANVVAKDWVTKPATKALAADLKLTEEDFPARPYLTVLKHSRVASLRDTDVVFSVSPILAAQGLRGLPAR